MKTTARPALAAPPAIWRSFQAQAAWKSWALVALLAIAGAEAVAIARLSTRPPEFVLVDSDGKTSFVKRAVASEPLLAFLAERTRPPDLSVVRFSRDFLQLALGIHSATVEANWPAALALMSPPLRERVRDEADRARLVDAYRTSQQRTDLAFEDVTIVTRAPGLVHVRAVVSRVRRSLVDAGAPAVSDRVAVDLALSSVTPSPSRPDGLEVHEWAVEQLAAKPSRTTTAGERLP
jgi:hypothetical protein